MKHINRDGSVDYDDYHFDDPEQQKAYRKERRDWESYQLLRLAVCTIVGLVIAFLGTKGVWEVIKWMVR